MSTTKFLSLCGRSNRAVFLSGSYLVLILFFSFFLITEVNAIQLRRINTGQQQQHEENHGYIKPFRKTMSSTTGGRRSLGGSNGEDSFYELCSFYGNGGCVQPSFKDIVLDSYKNCGAACVWYVEEIDAKSRVIFHNAGNQNMCIQAGYDGKMKDGTRLRYVSCDVKEELQQFFWDDDYEAPIRALTNNSLCMVSQGKSYNAGDNMILKDCDVRDDEWSGDQIDDDSRLESYMTESYYQLWDIHSGGYVQQSPSKPTDIIVDSNCGVSCIWQVDEVIGEDFYNSTIMFRNAMNKNMCLQAGNRDEPSDGTKIRYMSCDIMEPLQYFDWDQYEAPIMTADRDFCMVAQGASGKLGKNLILKDCEDRNDEWSGDAIDDDQLLDQLGL